MTKAINPHIVKAIPVLGWIIVVIGFFYPIGNRLVYIIWLMILFACAGLHTIQLAISIPLGKKAGLGYLEIIIKTLLFGAAWWMPFKHAITSEEKK